ncbi:MAG: hypothetical protein HXY35_02970 [Chloroflexi bacterium]|nr:hypothetical protein [Chloroflexota bacterium]
MSQFFISVSTWLHSIASVIFIGHFILLAGIYLPVLSKNGTTLSEISRRSRLWMYVSLLIFVVTGTHLMLIDPGYLGFMDFSNFWGIVMVVKHILVLAMLAMGFWFNAILHVGPMMSSNNPEQAIARFRKYVNAMAVCGALVLLLTALAQVE